MLRALGQAAFSATLNTGQPAILTPNPQGKRGLRTECRWHRAPAPFSATLACRCCTEVETEGALSCVGGTTCGRCPACPRGMGRRYSDASFCGPCEPAQMLPTRYAGIAGLGAAPPSEADCIRQVQTVLATKGYIGFPSITGTWNSATSAALTSVLGPGWDRTAGGPCALVPALTAAPPKPAPPPGTPSAGSDMWDKAKAAAPYVIGGIILLGVVGAMFKATTVAGPAPGAAKA